jgi:simple sugar transport system ATP-binding protein
VKKDYDKIVRMVNIRNSFGEVLALKGVDFEVGANEVVGLIGDNGAGKSTLVKILTGVYTPTSGELFIKERKVSFSGYNVSMAHDLGIETVYQESSLGEKQEMWRNIFIGREITNKLGFINIKKEKEIAQHIMLDLIGFRGIGVTVDSRANVLSGGERQGIAIGRAMHFEAELIVLDEPTVALSVKEIQKVLNFIRKIKSSGRSCVYISHTISHVYEVSDRFVIIDRGEIVAKFLKNEISLQELDNFLLKYATSKEKSS